MGSSSAQHAHSARFVSLRAASWINLAKPGSSLSTTLASPDAGGGTQPRSASVATSVAQPISSQRFRVKRDGFSRSNVTRCFGLLCLTQIGASNAVPLLVSTESATILLASTVGEPETTSFSCIRVRPFESINRMTSSPSPAIAISISRSLG
jgi:hypothetical protein